MNRNREKQYMSKILKEKGTALIKSFEAGAKTGMMGGLGSQASLQILLEETASLPDIDYIALVGKDGKILAHNRREMIGQTFNQVAFTTPLLPRDTSRWRIIDHGKEGRYFEVFKPFLPHFKGAILSRRRRDHPTCSGRMMCAPGWIRGMNRRQLLDLKHRPTIFIGMDIRPFEAAMADDLRHSMIMVSIVLALGLAGVVSLFWAQGYARSGKLLRDTRAFASRIVADLPVGIVALNRDFQVIYINEKACVFLDVTVAKARGMDGETLLPEPVWQLHETFKADHSPVVEKEISLVNRQQARVPVAVSFTDITADDGGCLGFMFLF
jgi:two-component system sensor histidine kinase HydH